jgi:hypothetical protein
MPAVCRRLDWVQNKCLAFFDVLDVLNRTNRTRQTNSKHANKLDGSGGPLIHYTNASKAVSNHRSLFDSILDSHLKF